MLIIIVGTYQYGSTVQRRSCRNRWLVAYTLLRNPSLQPLTASNIAQTLHTAKCHKVVEEEMEEEMVDVKNLDLVTL